MTDLSPLTTIMARLRDPVDGCAWDVAQTFATIAPYTIEEAYEVADAIERSDMGALCDELGDLLLQVVFHARIAQEAGAFDINAVITGICDKMIRRHPHVFGDGQTSPGWDEIKDQERASNGAKDNSALAGVATALPALMRAEKLQKRAARTGFDWPHVAGAIEKVREEIAEVVSAETEQAIEEEIGDLLFAVVNVSRHHGVDPEQALRAANRKFERRFRQMEDVAGDNFVALTITEKEALWQSAKRMAAHGE